MELTNRQALVIGMGKSGVAAAEFLLKKGAKVTICDRESDDKLINIVKNLADWPMKVITGAYPQVSKEYDLVVLSPGVPLQIKPVVQANKLKIPVIGEMELVAHFCPVPVVAITGTNGKTTTTALTGEILANGKNHVLVGGNIGITILEQLNEVTPDSLIVAEVSSFQLDLASSFKPKVAVILNITPDHLDRHGTFANYAAAKKKIFANQQSEDCLILNYDQQEVRYLAEEAKGKVIFFSTQHILEEGVFVSAGHLVARLQNNEVQICPIQEIRLKGSHNLENCLAAAAIGLMMGVEVEHIRTTLAAFPGVSHRLEPVAVINGVAYINDSKGTNPNATEKALAAFEQPIVLIAGGKDKGSSFEELLAKGKEKIKAMITIGQTAPKLLEAAAKVGITNVYPAATFAEVVATAYKVAESGDVVLLSPACASWDMFKSYEERGELFKKLVLELRG